MRLGTIAAVAVIVAAAAAQADPILSVLTPVGAGTCAGSDWQPLERLFDWQPTWTGTAVARDPDPGNGQYGLVSADMPGRWGYIDLGPDWASWRITQTWTGWRQWSAGVQNMWPEKKWTNMDVTNWDLPAFDDPAAVPETRLVLSGIDLPYANEARWLREGDYTNDPVVPQGRYLVMKSWADYATLNDRAAEYAFVGFIVPEPASMSLLALGGLALLRRRR